MLEIIALLLALCIGLLVYERFGIRLGGVLVLPLVTAYALFEPKLLPVFFLAAAAAYVAGELVQRHTLVYGRRLLYTYIVLGLVASAALLYALGIGVHGVVLAVLPGIFAFNVHREGRPLRSAGQFVAVLIPALLLTHLALVPFGFRGGLFEYAPWARAVGDTVGSWIAIASPFGTASAAPSPWLDTVGLASAASCFPEGSDAE